MKPKGEQSKTGELKSNITSSKEQQGAARSKGRELCQGVDKRVWVGALHFASQHVCQEPAHKLLVESLGRIWRVAGCHQGRLRHAVEERSRGVVHHNGREVVRLQLPHICRQRGQLPQQTSKQRERESVCVCVCVRVRVWCVCVCKCVKVTAFPRAFHILLLLPPTLYEGHTFWYTAHAN